MDGTATTPPGTHATATRWSGSSQQICTSGGVRTGRHRQPAAQRQRTRHAYMIRHGVTCHHRQHAATTARSMACMLPQRRCREQPSALSRRTVQCASACLRSHRAGDRCSPRSLRWWWGLIGGLHAYIHADTVPLGFWLLFSDVPLLPALLFQRASTTAPLSNLLLHVAGASFWTRNSETESTCRYRSMHRVIS